MFLIVSLFITLVHFIVRVLPNFIISCIHFVAFVIYFCIAFLSLLFLFLGTSMIHFHLSLSPIHSLSLPFRPLHFAFFLFPIFLALFISSFSRCHFTYAVPLSGRTHFLKHVQFLLPQGFTDL